MAAVGVGDFNGVRLWMRAPPLLIVDSGGLVDIHGLAAVEGPSGPKLRLGTRKKTPRASV